MHALYMNVSLFAKPLNVKTSIFTQFANRYCQNSCQRRREMQASQAFTVLYGGAQFPKNAHAILRLIFYKSCKVHSGVQGSRSQIMGWILGSKSGRRNQTWPGGCVRVFVPVSRKEEGIEASSVSSTGSSLQKRKA